MADNAIKEILSSNELSEIEVAITNECKTYVNKEHIDFTIGIVRREIANSDLTIDFIRKQLSLKKDAIIKLGIQILKAQRGKSYEEEYPKGEIPPEGGKTKIISSNGVGVGFGIKYAIYLDYLENKPKDLTEYLKKERIPYAAKFSKNLFELYTS